MCAWRVCATLNRASFGYIGPAPESWNSSVFQPSHLQCTAARSERKQTEPATQADHEVNTALLAPASLCERRHLTFKSKPKASASASCIIQRRLAHSAGPSTYLRSVCSKLWLPPAFLMALQRPYLYASQGSAGHRSLHRLRPEVSVPQCRIWQNDRLTWRTWTSTTLVHKHDSLIPA